MRRDYLDYVEAEWSISMISCLELLAVARTQRETNDLDLLVSGYRTMAPTENIARRA